MRLWDVDLQSWLKRACAIANRNLTREEWGRYMGDQPYRKTCPDLPGADDASQQPSAIEPKQRPPIDRESAISADKLVGSWEGKFVVREHP